jgi:uncharacterized protein YbaP (TraB family)
MKTIVICLALLLTGWNLSFAQYKKGLVWEISGKGLKQPAYIFGTIHLFDTSRYEQPQLPYQLLDKVDKVYFEIDFSKMDVNAMMTQIFMTDTTQYLNRVLDAAAIRKLNQLAANSPMLNILGKRMYAIKPILLQSMAFGAIPNNVTLDFELYKAVMEKGIPVGGLETVNDQMAAIDRVPIPKQTDMLKKTLQENISPEQQLRTMTETYCKQDIEDLMTVINDNVPVDASFDEAIRAERNTTMANKIDSLLHTGHPLIAIGSGHLGNNNGLLKLLQQKGYKLKNIPFVIKKAHE